MGAQAIEVVDLFDLEGLVANINSLLHDSEEHLELENFAPGRVRQPLSYRIDGKKMEACGRHFITQPHEWGMLHPFNPLGEIGYVYVENGATNGSSHTTGSYKTARLRIKKPLQLNDGRIIPNCLVEISEETEDLAGPSKHREDRIISGIFSRRRADLSDMIHTDWFLRTSGTTLLGSYSF